MAVFNSALPTDSKEIIETARKYSLFTWMSQNDANPIAVKEGKGCWYTDYDGQKWFDLGDGLVSINVGYGQQKVVDAMAEQAAADPKIPGFVKFFGPSWSSCKAKFDTEEEYTDFLLDMLEQQLICEGPETVAAIFLESIPGSSVAVQLPPVGYYKKLRKICDKYGIMMVIDEVMAGFGRSGKMFSFEHFDYTPDLVTFAKGVTSSYAPLGGVMVRKELCEKHPSIDHITGKWGLYHGMFAVDKLCTEEYGQKIMNELRAHHMTTLGKMGHFMVSPDLVITEEEVKYVLDTLDECCTTFDSWL